MANKLEIEPGDAGRSVLRFLERRAGLARADVYRWLRSGEIRLNGGRVKAERILAAGDVLRLPPQAGALPPSLSVCLLAPDALGGALRIVFQDDRLLVLDKPAGLATQGGSGQGDSLSARLRAACGPGCHVPAPAHRLDKHASGLIAAGKTPAALAWLHGLFRAAKPDLQRAYYCWVRGDASAALAEACELRDFLGPELGADGRERMAALPEGAEGTGGKEAAANYRCLELRRHPQLGPLSLLEARLLTGRKHQIRVQLASRGWPLVGDGRYGGPTGYPMLLHAWRLVLPAQPGAGEFAEFVSPPPWTGFFAMGDRNE